MKKFNFSIDVDSWLEIDVEANTSKEAKEKLMGMSLEELIEEGYVKGFDITDIDCELMEDEDLDELSETIENAKDFKREMEKDLLEEQLKQHYQNDKKWFEQELEELKQWLLRKANELEIKSYRNTQELIEAIFIALEWTSEPDLEDDLIELMKGVELKKE